MTRTVGLVASAAGGLAELRTGLVKPLLARGLTVAVTVTPTAATWLDAAGETERLAELTGLPVRTQPRLPTDPRPHPQPDVCVAAPATANTVAKLALGIADNQALTVLCENLGSTPTVVFPNVNAAHARHPAWDQHLTVLRTAGVDLVYGDDVWPLFEPRRAPPERTYPWPAILTAVDRLLPSA